MAQVSNGWEAVVCDAPDDFFRAFRPDGLQIFIADDAFGRTEYDPARGAKWEAQLHRVFSRLGSSHWLAWTSRRHILERARKRMDLQGSTADFPKPAEIVVDAGRLTVQDKAIILYRHSKHGLHDPKSRSMIRRYAVQIVSDDAFTPERIRRFIEEGIPQLTANETQTADPVTLANLIAAEIQHPTDRMRNPSTPYRFPTNGCFFPCSKAVIIQPLKTCFQNTASSTTRAK
jgi:hypothetical protein